jgi:transcriptional regulator with XRE-family HTH domain
MNGQRLRFARKAKGLTQKQLAEMMGFKTHSTINQYETGKSKPGHDDLIKLADILDVSMDYLSGRTDVKNIIHIEGDLENFLNKEGPIVYKGHVLTSEQAERAREVLEFVLFQEAKKRKNT